MLKQGLLGSELLGMLSAHAEHVFGGVPYIQQHGRGGYTIQPFYNAPQPHYQPPQYAAPQVIRQMTLSQPYTSFKYKSDNHEEYLTSNIPVVLIEYLFGTLGSDDVIVIESSELKYLIEDRLRDSLVKLTLNSDKANFAISFIKEKKEDDPNIYYSVSIDILDDIEFTKKDYSNVFNITDDILSTLKYEEFLYLKNRRHIAE